MNVAGISTPPALPAPPAIARVDHPSHAETNPQKNADAEAKAKAKAAEEQARRPVVEAPPIKPLSTTEMRVLMGGLPPDALFEAAKRPGKGHFDGYA